MSSVLEKAFGTPSDVVTNHGVEDGQEFAHTGGDDDLGYFACFLQALGEGADDRVASDGSERGHIKHATDGSASGEDGSFALPCSGLAVVRRHAD